MKNKFLSIIFFIILTNLYFFTKCTTIGSDSAVNKFSTQQTLYNSDRIATFAALNSGFKINGAGDTITFDSIFPVSGDIELNLGTISLSTDLFFHNLCDIKTLGNITGNNHTIKFSKNTSSLPTLNDTYYFSTSAIMPDQINTVDWSYDNKFVAVGLERMEATAHSVLLIYEFTGSSLTLRASESSDQYRELTCVRWHPTKHLLAASSYQADVGKKELKIFEFNSDTYAFTEKSGLEFNLDVYATSWHPSGNYLAIGRYTTQQVSIYSVSATGVINSSPLCSHTFTYNRRIRKKALCWNSAGSHLVVGTETGTADDELLVFSFNSGAPSLSLDSSLPFTVNVFSVNWNQTHDEYIAAALDGSGACVRIYTYNYETKVLTEVTNDNNAQQAWEVSWSPDGAKLAVARFYDAAKDELEVYSFDYETDTLSKISGFNFAVEIETTRFAPNSEYIVAGGDTKDLCVYNSYQNNQILFSNTNLLLNSNITLQGCNIHFSGASSIIGNGNVLTLEDSTITVNSSSSLLLKDIIVAGIATNNIALADSTSTLKVQNATWELYDSFKLTAGKLDIIDTFDVLGETYTFSFLSPSQGTVYKNSTFVLHDDTTFYYAPTNESKTLLNLSTNSSQLVLNGAQLYTAKGISLTKGILLINNNSSLSNDSTLDAEAIKFGDGASSTNNLTIQIAPAAYVYINSGKIIDNNI